MLLRATAELRQQFTGHRDALPDTAIEDFARLFDAAGRLETMTAEWREGQSTHDLMNVLSALRGYSEMLREDLNGSPADLDGTLARLLSAVQTVHTGESTEASKTDTGSHRAITSEPGFILAVDDLQENRELVARYLSRNGHMVVTAASGEEALRHPGTSDVDVVLLDLMMPGMDGREVLRRIKDHPDWRATPVIVISGQPGYGRHHRVYRGRRRRLPVQTFQSRTAAGQDQGWHRAQALARPGRAVPPAAGAQREVYPSHLWPLPVRRDRHRHSGDDPRAWSWAATFAKSPS